MKNFITKQKKSLILLLVKLSNAYKGLSDSVNILDQKIHNLLGILIALISSLLGIMLFKMANLNYIILICSFVILIASIISIFLLYCALKTQKYQSIGNSPSNFLEMENVDIFYTNLIGKKAGMCAQMEDKIKDNISKHSIRCKYYNKAILIVISSLCIDIGIIILSCICYNFPFFYKLFSSYSIGFWGGGGTGLPAFLTWLLFSAI